MTQESADRAYVVGNIGVELRHPLISCNLLYMQQNAILERQYNAT
jgi:hypothetical protein